MTNSLISRTASRITKMLSDLLKEQDSVKGLVRSICGNILYEKLRLASSLGYWPKIRKPRSFNEKVSHRKFFTDKQKFSDLEDKWKVREYVEEKTSASILPEVYEVTEKPEKIDFDELPKSFVVKAIHGCGWNIIVEDKEDVDFEEIREACREWLSSTYGESGNEYWYQNIEPKILIEEYLQSEDRESLRDYKFYVFNGKVEYIHIDLGRGTENHTRRFYDRNWEPQNFELKYPLGPEIEKPENMEKMIQIAEKLGEGINFVRVDLYNIDDERIVFGEITIGPGGARAKFTPKKADFELGKHWQIE